MQTELASAPSVPALLRARRNDDGLALRVKRLGLWTGISWREYAARVDGLAREMIELHSLGVGADYSQKDVRELAELLTGLSYSPRDEKIFRPNRAEPGAETVLGRSYGGDGPGELNDIRTVIGDLARHPATARHLARKLATHDVQRASFRQQVLEKPPHRSRGRRFAGHQYVR